MSARARSWARLNAEVKAGNFEDKFLSLVADGESPAELSWRVFGISWRVMRQWIEGSNELMQEFEAAKRAGADKLMYEALSEVRGADVETVGLAKLRADRFDRMAGKLDRRQWGDKVEVSIEQRISIVDVLKEARGRVIEVEDDKPEKPALPHSGGVTI